MQRFLLIKSSQEKSQVTEKERMQISDCKISITVITGWDFILDSMVCYGRLKANGQHMVLHSKSRSGIHKLCLSFIKSLVRIDIWGNHSERLYLRGEPMSLPSDLHKNHFSPLEEKVGYTDLAKRYFLV